LVKALVQSPTHEAGFKADERYPLATAAEYLQQVLSADRSIFLAEFRRILDEKSAHTGRIATHDFILSMATPWLVVSAAYDWTLETALIGAGKPFAVVAHIIRAADRTDEGKLLILRHDDVVSTEIRLADDWVLSDLGRTSERVIYKLVGSPYLHDTLEPERVDTVVITETDHVEFLSRLQNEHARVPSAFTPLFNKGALLFLGYNLDVWHYRLVGHIFSDGGLIKTVKRFAVRTATSPIEERFWSRLVAAENRLQSDCEAFVRAFGGR
jgi:SIR2-like protein